MTTIGRPFDENFRSGQAPWLADKEIGRSHELVDLGRESHQLEQDDRMFHKLLDGLRELSFESLIPPAYGDNLHRMRHSGQRLHQMTDRPNAESAGRNQNGESVCVKTMLPAHGSLVFGSLKTGSIGIPETVTSESATPIAFKWTLVSSSGNEILLDVTAQATSHEHRSQLPRPCSGP